jgi:hypothetical protein
LNVDPNAVLTFAAIGGFVPVGKQSFTLVDKVGSDAIIGSFAGLTEGKLIPNFLGSGLTATITYSGGTGNDVVLAVSDPVTVSPATLPNWTSGFAGYNSPVSASGGAGAKTFAVSAGSLPTGLLLNSTTGAITGTPAVPSTVMFAITATDGAGSVGTHLYSVVISPAVALNPATLANATLFQNNYNQTVIPSGGTGTVTLTHTGTIPPGMTFNDATGSLTGPPSAAGTFSFTITATDAIGAHRCMRSLSTK